jgi:hypothetical protein
MSLVLLMSGCQSLAERKQTTQLQDILRNYEGVVRWGTVDQIRRFYRAEVSDGMLNKPSAKMRVTHYEVVQGPTVMEENRAIQTAVIQYVFVESQVVRELVDQQVWEYETEDERWYLISPSPDFK